MIVFAALHPLVEMRSDRCHGILSANIDRPLLKMAVGCFLFTTDPMGMSLLSHGIFPAFDANLMQV